MKKCNKCKKIKLFSEFYRRNAYSPSIEAGYRYICKFCDNKLSIKKRKVGGWKNEKIRQGPGSKHAKSSKLNSKKHRTKMSDMYIRSLMTKKSLDLDSKDIPQDLVNLHRVNLALKRELRLTPELKEGED